MVIEGQYVKDGTYILWAWSLQEEIEKKTEETAEYIHSMCLSCSATNVGENHECAERQAA